MIRKAQLEDIPDILEILKQNLLSNLSKIDDINLESRGFIIFDFDAKVLKKMILDTKHFIVLVAQEADELIGYAISHDDNNAAHTLYHKHIAILPNKKGVAKHLMQGIIQEAIKRHYQFIVCDIAHYPVKNSVSIAFHQKHGFKFVKTHQEEHVELGLYQLDINQFNSNI